MLVPPPRSRAGIIGGRAASRKLSGARLPRRQRPIGTFTRRKEHDAYQKALERLLRDLKVGASPAADG
jgi:hypothetical protein